jgi:hypothetical protein
MGVCRWRGESWRNVAAGRLPAASIRRCLQRLGEAANHRKPTPDRADDDAADDNPHSFPQAVFAGSYHCDLLTQQAALDRGLSAAITNDDGSECVRLGIVAYLRFACLP